MVISTDILAAILLHLRDIWESACAQQSACRRNLHCSTYSSANWAFTPLEVCWKDQKAGQIHASLLVQVTCFHRCWPYYRGASVTAVYSPVISPCRFVRDSGTVNIGQNLGLLEGYASQQFAVTLRAARMVKWKLLGWVGLRFRYVEQVQAQLRHNNLHYCTLSSTPITASCSSSAMRN